MFRRIWMQQDYTRKVSGRKWHDITNVNGQLKGKGKKALEYYDRYTCQYTIRIQYSG